MASVEEGSASGEVDLSLAARVTGIAAIVVGASEFLILVANFAMTEAVYAVLGNAGFFWIFHILWIVKAAGTAVVAGGLIVGWRQAPLLWTPGIGLVALGLVVNWGWWAVDRFTDVWGFARFTGVEPDNPDLVWIVRASEWTNIAVSVVATALLVSGGIQLLRGHRSTE